MLKKFMLGAALAAMFAAPALAQSYDPEIGSGNIVGPGGGAVTAGTPAYLTPHSKAYAHVQSGGGYAYAPGWGSNAYAYQPRARRGDASINDKVYQPGGSYWREMQRRSRGQY